MAEYNWKNGAPFKVDAEKAHKRIEKIRSELPKHYNNEDLKAAIVEDAKDPTSPLHDEFEWDDARAAEMYRKKTAGKMARSIEVKYNHGEKGPKTPTRVYVNVNKASETGRYEPVADVLSDDEKRRQALENAMKELQNLQAKYSQWEGLCNLFTRAEKDVEERIEILDA